jgi:hypothetical protein
MALLDGGMLKRQKSWVKVSIHLLVDFVSVPYAILNCTNVLVHKKMALLDVDLVLVQCKVPLCLYDHIAQAVMT